jgi:hypothetical protein
MSRSLGGTNGPPRRRACRRPFGVERDDDLVLPIGRWPAGRDVRRRVGERRAGFSDGGFSGGYVVRRADDLQLFSADSGSVRITQVGSVVSGTFTLYFKHYDVIPKPTPENIGKPIAPFSSGESTITISGSFDAAKR